MHALSAILQVFVSFTGARPLVLPLREGILQKTTLGKLSRAKIRTSLENKEYADEEHKNSESIKQYREARHAHTRSESEIKLTELVEETLQLDSDSLDARTPVFETGVTSIDLIRLKSRIEKSFELDEIPMIGLMSNATVRDLALVVQRMQTSPTSIEYDPVVTLQHRGDKTPLWLIHPGIGEILVFLGLAKYITDRPVHAMRARGFNNGEPLFADLNDVVSSYYNSLKRRQPSGPYAIAGYSYGSMIAFEIAKRLEHNGDVVSFLGSFNLPPHIKERMKQLDWTAGLLHIAFFCELINEQKSEEMLHDLRLLSQEEAIDKLLSVSDANRVAELGMTHRSLAKWVNVSYSLQKLGTHYEPSGHVERLDVFFCDPLRVVASSREEFRSKHLEKWQDFCRERPQYYSVQGAHYTMLSPENVQSFQSKLKQVLQSRGL